MPPISCTRVFEQRKIIQQLVHAFRRNAFHAPHLSIAANAAAAHVTNRKRLSTNGALCERQAAPAMLKVGMARDPFEPALDTGRLISKPEDISSI